MAGKRWLNIVVDGNIALQPFWHDIVTNYLENIIRSFRGNLLEEAYLGLVLYNANTLVEAGDDIQFINWTKDANKFIESLSCLTFKGNGANQCTMAEGLAEALVMYPKPSDIMPTIDYYNGERHCILIAPGDPTPKRMMLCLPMINPQGNLVGQRLKARGANFLDVSQLFTPLRTSLSVIAPNSLSIFRAIFNLGNDALLSNVPISSYSNGQLSILMSKKFQYAHNALIQENRPSTTSVESMYTTTPTIPRVLATNIQVNNIASPACEVSIGEGIGGASRTDFVFPNEVSPTDTALASFCHSQMNVYDDIMTDLFAPSKRSKTMVILEEDILKDLFEPDEQNPFDSTGQEIEQGESSSTRKVISIDALKAVENQFEEALKDGSNKTSNVELISSSSKGVLYIPPSELLTHTSSVVEEYSIQDTIGDQSILNTMLSSDNPSTSATLVPDQQHPPSVGQEYSTSLHQDIIRSNTSTLLNPMFSSKNLSSTSAALVTQQHPPSVGEDQYLTRLLQGGTNKSVLNLILNSENPPSTSVVSVVPQPSVGEEYSTRLHGISSNKSVLKPMLSSENPSRLLHGKTSDKSILNPMLISENSSNSNSPQISTAATFGEDTFSNTMGNSLLQFHPYSSQNQFPLMPEDGSSQYCPTRPMGNFSKNQYQSNHMASFGALNTSTFATFNHRTIFLQVPAIDNFRYYVQTWEGSLKGRIHPNRLFMIKAKAFRSPTTSLMLTVKWKNKLEILNFIPEKAVNDTKNIYNPIGYVFFHVVQFHNVDLYKYLKSSNLCGKIDLSFQSIIISPTEKENYFLGTVFDRGAVFVEQH